MLEETAPAPLAARLRALLDGDAPALSDQVLAAARALGPERAGELVSSLLDLDLARPRDGVFALAAVRAAHLAGELRLARAIPALVQCVELLPDGHPVRRAALAAVARLGAAPVDALLAAFHGCESTEGRTRLAEALARAPGGDDRIRAALVRLLETDPENAARHLAERGEWRAAPDLSSALDRLAVAPVGDCLLCSTMHLGLVASALRDLGGIVSDAQLRAIDAFDEGCDPLWTPWDDDTPPTRREPPRLPATRPARPGRNAPCPCGSGKKYKKCHLGVDPGDFRH